MSDRRLQDSTWRSRTGFDNIDPNPKIEALVWRPLADFEMIRTQFLACYKGCRGQVTVHHFRDMRCAAYHYLCQECGGQRTGDIPGWQMDGTCKRRQARHRLGQGARGRKGA